MNGVCEPDDAVAGETDVEPSDPCADVHCEGDLQCCNGNCCAAAACCDGYCVELADDPHHCGACERRCGAREICVASTCVCNAPFATCDPESHCATDLLSDAQHCGRCNVGCPEGTVCEGGQCGCPTGFAQCAGSPPCAVDLRSNNLHCGICDHACADTCVDGRCLCGADLCADDQQCCSTGWAMACVPFNSPRHCGACGVACGDGEVCHQGQCRCGELSAQGSAVCSSGQICCGGSCMSPDDPRCRCGVAQEVCTQGEICCSDTCVNIYSDDSHCGGCGLSCPSGLQCRDGACQCPLSTPNLCQTSTGLVCVALSADANHCGTCNNDCSQHEHVAAAGCNQGRCLYTCATGFADCDLAVPGCESALDAPQHCGACANDCFGPNVLNAGCDAGQCQILTCQPGTYDCDEIAANGCESLQACRSRAGLVALYTFDTPGGVVTDQAAHLSPPPHLDIVSPEPHWLIWQQPNGLLIDRNEDKPERAVYLLNAQAASLRQALTATDAFSVEIWIRPEDANFRTGTLLLFGHTTTPHLEVRRENGALRVTLDTANGTIDRPGIASLPRGKITHVVFTYDASAQSIAAYIDGQRILNANASGGLSTWSGNTLQLANALDFRRGYRGAYYGVAIYNRALNQQEVRNHRDAGPHFSF